MIAKPLSVYIHVPFCASRCVYCDFFSTTSLPLREAYLRALERELAERSCLARTIYIGGGTPSMLSPKQLAELFAMVERYVERTEGAEITLEANPDDVSDAWVAALRRTPVNRVSLGIQTFDDGILRLLRRRHTAQEAREAVGRLQMAGYDNISVDLIYGLPGQTIEALSHDLDEVLALAPQHVSAYALMVEEGTALYAMRERGEVEEADEELSLAMYRLVCQRLREAGFEHYEVSNFARAGFRSRHNSTYWTGGAYHGFGPGAHSYDGERVRSWNPSSLQAYLQGVVRESEMLTDDELFEERVFLGLRRREGLSLDDLRHRFGQERVRKSMERGRAWLRGGKLIVEDDCLRLSPEGVFVSDAIVADLI